VPCKSIKPSQRRVSERPYGHMSAVARNDTAGDGLGALLAVFETLANTKAPQLQAAPAGGVAPARRDAEVLWAAAGRGEPAQLEHELVAPDGFAAGHILAKPGPAPRFHSGFTVSPVGGAGHFTGVLKQPAAVAVVSIIATTLSNQAGA
jgi:hypothetical protein